MENYFDLFNIDYYFEYMQHILSTTNTFSEDFFSTISKIKSGVYLNKNNIIANIFIYLVVFCVIPKKHSNLNIINIIQKI